MTAEAIEVVTGGGDGLRPIRPVGLSGLEPAMAIVALPVFEWVSPSALLVDEAYQRNLSERSIKLIRKIIENWDWRRFKPPVCARTAKGLEVIDGQHTAVSAASHPAIDLIPVMVVEAAERAERASAFMGHNRDRLNITPMQLHYAAAAAGDEDAQTIDQVCARAGVRMLKSTPANGVFKPGDTVAVAAIGALINRRMPVKARQVLEILAQAGCAPVAAGQIKAVDVLLHDPEYAGEITADDLVSAIIKLGSAADQEAAVFAATHKVPKWKALAITYFRKARRRGRRSEG